MGFGYYPDGVYGCIRGQPCEGTELEAEVVPPSGGAPGCNTAKNCQYPLYYGGETGNDLLGLEAFIGAQGPPTAVTPLDSNAAIYGALRWILSVASCSWQTRPQTQCVVCPPAEVRAPACVTGIGVSSQ